ncbi:transporter [Ganoderma sinense ZZ0214-1]|uniref:Transporter n=1 Tax=Ganoderma sinense ZZ0214-1 TaxID=1077348 RepID=A0A2G8RRR9_9APHY|nr:transporter [Ganoderma sinense ZZ0214-1]
MPTDRARSYSVDLTPRKHHGYAVFLFILGTLLPPLAVAARFGIGTDFGINLVLTICGYIPGHVHNFYIQNIRNNKTHRRTPKWAQKWGLVDTSEIKRKERRSQWANRYNDRLPRSTLEGQPYEEGEVGGSSIDLQEEGGDSRSRGGRRNTDNELWNPSEERYYGQKSDSSSTVGRSSGRWQYPANFDDALPPSSSSRKKSVKKEKKEKKDRWARTEDAYAAQETSGSTRRRKSKKGRTNVAEMDTYSQRSESTTEFPEDPEGGLYGDRRPAAGTGDDEREGPRRTTEEEIFNHEL